MKHRSYNINNLMTNPDPFSLAEIYHENSKLRGINGQQYGEFISSITSYPQIVEKMSQSYKVYPTHNQIDLPKQFSKTEKSIETIIENRRTVREFSGESLAVEEISKLLHFSYGITASIPIPHLPTELQFFRAAPSAGALYPLEIYLIAWNIEGLESGIYHYNVLSHSLESLKKGNFSDLAGEYLLSKEITSKASSVLIISAIFQRTMFKYQERGYRFVLLDAGHVAQNFCLMASAMNIGTVPIGGFLDDELNSILELDGVNETVLYPLIVGKY